MTAALDRRRLERNRIVEFGRMVMHGIRLLPRAPGSRARLGVGLRYLVAAALVIVVMSQNGDGTQLSLIPTLIALGSKKFFGKDKGDPDTALADNPAVAFVLGALTTGNTDAADEMIAPNAAAYANGYTILDPADGDSPARFVDNVGFWRSQIPDLSIEVFDDIVEKHRHKTLDVAVRFVMSGTLPGDAAGSGFEFEGAAFVTVVDEQATEWRLIVDSQVVEDLVGLMKAETDE
jgi:hypothetical protein